MWTFKTKSDQLVLPCQQILLRASSSAGCYKTPRSYSPAHTAPRVDDGFPLLQLICVLLVEFWEEGESPLLDRERPLLSPHCATLAAEKDSVCLRREGLRATSRRCARPPPGAEEERKKKRARPLIPLLVVPWFRRARAHARAGLGRVAICGHIEPCRCGVVG